MSDTRANPDHSETPEETGVSHAEEDRPRAHPGASRLRVVFLPQWFGNPYQRLLDEHLSALGVLTGRFPQDVWSITKGLFKIRPHILHLHWLHPFYETAGKRRSWLRLLFSLKAFLILRLLGVRIVWTAHNLEHHEAKNQRIDRVCNRWVVRLAGGIIVHSESARKRLMDRFKLEDGSRIAVIPHGHYISSYKNDITREEARRRLDLPEHRTVFLFFGQIRPYKGVLELVEAFHNLESDDAHLIIAGKPLSQASTQTVHDAIASHANVTFHPGFVPDDDVQVYMNASDAFVLPYRDVLTSGAALLAMSFGQACIAPATACFTELLDDTGALLYDPEDEGALCGAMEHCVQRHGELAEMGRHNLRLAKQLDWTTIAQRTLDLYRQA